MIILHCKIKVTERRSLMRLTTEEMRDMVSTSIIAFLAHRGEMDIDIGVDVVNWVDTQDFEFRLEALREDW